MGQEIYMDDEGNIIIDNGRGGQIKFDTKNNTVKVDDMNFNVVTEAGLLSFGVASRSYTDPVTGEVTTRLYTTNGTPVNSSNDTVATEFVLKVVPYADNDPTTDPNINNPIAEFRMGNDVSEQGQPQSPWHCYLKVNDSEGNEKALVALSKNGQVLIKADAIGLGTLDEDFPAVLGNKLKQILDVIKETIRNHTHQSNNMPPDANTISRISTINTNEILSKIVRTR